MSTDLPQADYFIEIGGPTWSTPISQEVRDKLSLLFRFFSETGNPTICVMIHSFGGNTMAGIEIGEMFQMYKGIVHTHAMSICKSAAATILMSGHIRTASPGSLIGFHASSDTDQSNPPKKIVCKTTTEASKDHIAMCIGLDVFSSISSYFDVLEMTDLSAKAALDCHILTHPAIRICIPDGKAPFRIH